MLDLFAAIWATPAWEEEKNQEPPQQVLPLAKLEMSAIHRHAHPWMEKEMRVCSGKENEKQSGMCKRKKERVQVAKRIGRGEEKKQ